MELSLKGSVERLESITGYSLVVQSCEILTLMCLSFLICKVEISTYSQRIVERIKSYTYDALRAVPGIQEVLSTCSLFLVRKTKRGNSLQTWTISAATLDFVQQLEILATVSASPVMAEDHNLHAQGWQIQS